MSNPEFDTWFKAQKQLNIGGPLRELMQSIFEAGQAAKRVGKCTRCKLCDLPIIYVNVSHGLCRGADKAEEPCPNHGESLLYVCEGCGELMDA